MQSPKNLCYSAAIKSAELMEHFMWIESSELAHVFNEKRREVQREVTDAVQEKLVVLNERYLACTSS